jgi:hypothetical protein
MRIRSPSIPLLLAKGEFAPMDVPDDSANDHRTLFSVLREEEGTDARPALRFRQENNID